MTFQNKMLTLDTAIERYGQIDLAARLWPEMNKWMTMVEVPKDEFPDFTIMETKIPVRHIACNRDIAAPLRLVFDGIVRAGLQSKLVTYDGCFNIRAVRGEPGRLSTHSYGLAIDFNAATNVLGTLGDMSEELAKIFEEYGFIWGKRFSRQDPQHFSRAWEG